MKLNQFFLMKKQFEESFALKRLDGDNFRNKNKKEKEKSSNIELMKQLLLCQHKNT